MVDDLFDVGGQGRWAVEVAGAVELEQPPVCGLLGLWLGSGWEI